MNHIKKSILLLTLIIILLFSPNCKSEHSKEKINYKEMTFKNLKTLFETKEFFRIGTGIKKNKDVIFLFNYEVFLMNIETGKIEKLFSNGLGSGEITYGNQIYYYDGEVYICSLLESRFLFHFNLSDAQKKELKLSAFENPKSLLMDDFALISKDVVAMVNPRWENGYLRFFDLSQKKFLPAQLGKKTNIQKMGFNVNTLQVDTFKDKLFITESINPAIQVVDLKKMSMKEAIPLEPPFYIHHSNFQPPKRTPENKYDDKKVEEWQSKWTAIYEMGVNNGWILIKYRFGYDARYCYELLNIENTRERYFIKESPNFIMDFVISGKLVEFLIFEESDESLVWKKCELELH